MIKFIKELFNREIKPRKNAKTHDFTYPTWGHALHAKKQQNGNFRCNGHSGKDIVAGDIVLLDVQSGNIGKFIVIDMEFMTDPHDQFFGTITYMKENNK